MNYHDFSPAAMERLREKLPYLNTVRIGNRKDGYVGFEGRRAGVVKKRAGRTRRKSSRSKRQ